MNIVYDKKTLGVIYIFDNSFTGDSGSLLKSMFPHNYSSLALWIIDKKTHQNPIFLSVKLDGNKCPDILLYRGKEIYRASQEDKMKAEQIKIEEGKKALAQLLPRVLRTSVNQDIIKLWATSPYTDKAIIDSIKNFDYFLGQKTIPASWWGTFVDAGGYGNMNRSIVFRLHNHHVIAKSEIVPSLPQISQMGQYYVNKHSLFDFRRIKRYTKIYGFGPQPHPPHNGRSVFFTMMETETLHPTFRDLCNMYADEVWVPSLHNLNLFRNGGITEPIYLIPLGMDETIYRGANIAPNGVINRGGFCDILGKPASEGINSFRFFTVFGWSFRKGVDILIKSFVKAFSGDDDVALIIASTHVGPDKVIADVQRYAPMVRKSNYPQILFVPGVTPELEMPALYKMGHAFIHTSRGEGFSLPQIEAAACGLPVISTNNTGMSQYLTSDNSYMITTDKKEYCSPEMHWISGYYHGQLFPELGEDQIDQTVQHMHYVANNYEVACKKGEKLTNLVFSEYTWNKTAERVADRLKEIG